MSKSEIDEITKLLDHTTLPPQGVSFSNKGLKVDTAEDAQVIIDEMEKCGENMEFLNLEGNTFGIEGAEAVAKALEKHSKLKRAYWRDMFTSRSKSEIPVALIALSKGLMTAGAQLDVLELSDNASGPIGVDGIKDLIRSPTCYTLKELRLNNMGLGITGGTMLAEALTDCYKNSVKNGTPLSLKVFIAGRNRLENRGATALGKVFELINTLEEIQMPQNGIYYEGITELCKGLAKSKNLRLINLNDNSLRPEGAAALASLVEQLKNLVHLDVGDCLLRNKGALSLAEALSKDHKHLERVDFSGNEINFDGGLALLQAVIKSPHLKSINLGTNQFGRKGVERLMKEAQKLSDPEILSVSDDESDGDEDENEEGEDSEDYHESDETDSINYQDEDEDEDDDDDNESWVDYTGVPVGAEEGGWIPENQSIQLNFQTNGGSIEVSPLSGNVPQENTEEISKRKSGSFEVPPLGPTITQENIEDIVSKVKLLPDADKQIEVLLQDITSISIYYKSAGEDKKRNIEDCTMRLYNEMFNLANEKGKTNNINNLLPAYLGIIKNESKKPLVEFFDADCSLKLLKIAMTKEFFPKETINILNFIIEAKGLLH